MMMNNVLKKKKKKGVCVGAGGGGGGGGGSGGGGVPGWLERMMGERFFEVCGVHHGRKKNEKNIFCLHCCHTICPHCLHSHRSHPLLQVRRYVYNDVIRLGDLEKLIDCSYIQPYTINGAKVIFLHQRPQSRMVKGSPNICFNCDRILQEPFHFCSLQCKVYYWVNQGEDLSRILLRFNESDFSIMQFEGFRVEEGSELGAEEEEEEEAEGQITPTCSLDVEELMVYRGPRVNSGNSHLKKNNNNKQGGSGFLSGIVSSLSSRRKGAPHRAPFS